ncbi:hypothetical protein Slin15195_G022880 [Septoria linicola]|uniref:Zn(2)-C6 fungal-type domain-containing protein n=1 Tax=Septoria linicola TaxID=215465 RepID=A0A9Q9AJE1_9PEZI|nr:hypothetical protein Slin15195_G022880 [Septoria linicola]
MPSTTTLKRATDSEDGDEHSGSGSNSTPQPANKIPRVDSGRQPNGISHEHGDFLGGVPAVTTTSSSSSSKKKAAGSTRTGQACDRCKVRKIRCDARPGGCSPCIQNNSECKTTDRITGRATARGHAEQVENENTSMKMYIIELQQQLRDSGLEPKAAPSSQDPYGQYWGQQQEWPRSYAGQSALSTSPQVRNDRQAAQGSLLPDFRSGCIGDNYLGVSSENTWLSPIEGTSLALFGTKIDLAEFMPSDSDPASSAMSYRTFLSHAFGRHQVFRPDLPAYEQCKVYAEWYFRSIQQFIPVLHKPDFMSLLYKVHNENYQAKPAENVMIHMVLAVINFQFSARNSNEQARQDSMSHYHYACSLIPDLITGHTLADIQALTLICSQLRNQPRPGPAWMFTNLVLGLAIESGLHRSAKAWPNTGVEQDPHHLEMRKRTFWTILIFHVHISGKLGRPMPLRLEDFDIEMPEAIPDNLPEETSNKWKDCSFRAAIEGFKLLKIMMQVYSTIYSIKSTGQYEMNVRHLQKELEEFHTQVPAEFRGGPQTRDEDRISALYLDMSVAECQILLHHPALCRSASPQFMASNLDVCLHWSSKLLQCAVSVKNLNALDTTWYSTTNFLAAIFTTLFAHTERRDQMTSTDLQRLRQDMDSWLEVMSEVANLLGLSSQLQAAIRTIIDFSLGNIQRHIAAKTASAALPATSSPGEAHAQTYSSGNSYGEQYANGTSGDINGNHGHAYSNGHDEQTHNYQQNSQYGYPPAHENGVYAQSTMNGYDQSACGGDTKPNIEDQLLQATSLAQQQAAQATQLVQQPGPASYLAAFQSSTSQASDGYHQSTAGLSDHSAAYPQAGPAAWRHFADAMMNHSHVNGHEYMTSAAGLMALNGKTADGANPDMVAAAQMSSMQMPHSNGTQPPWPLLQYTSSHGGQH